MMRLPMVRSAVRSRDVLAVVHLASMHQLILLVGSTVHDELGETVLGVWSQCSQVLPQGCVLVSATHAVTVRSLLLVEEGSR